MVVRATVGGFLEACVMQADLKRIDATAAADYEGGAAAVGG